MGARIPLLEFGIWQLKGNDAVRRLNRPTHPAIHALADVRLVAAYAQPQQPAWITVISAFFVTAAVVAAVLTMRRERTLTRVAD